MTNIELANKIIEIQKNNNISDCNLNKFIKNHFNDLYVDIESRTIKLNQYKKIKPETGKVLDISIFERLYCILNNLDDRPVCRVCNKNKITHFIRKEFRYSYWCSPKCQASDKLCIEKSKKTRLERYGNQHYCGSDKAKQTKLKKYGSFTPPDFRYKMRLTKIAKYGNPTFVNPDKAKQTKKLKYGDENFNNTQKNIITRKTNFFNNVILKNENVLPLFTVDDYVKDENNGDFKWKCLTCNSEFIAHFDYNFNNKFHIKCKNCYPSQSCQKSKPEKEIDDFISEIYNDTILFNRFDIIPPLELDIYLPKLNLAIEFDGLYWHSSSNKEDNYHLMKTLVCEEKGIQLIHIFEDEWEFKKDIIKNKLKNLIGIYDKVIFARNCIIENISQDVATQFYSLNSIQQYKNSRINLGLFYNTELVGIMAFTPTCNNSKNKWEITGWCLKSNYHIPGAVSKFLKQFTKTWKPISIIGSIDRRWSNGKVFKKLGFQQFKNNLANVFLFKQKRTLY